VTNWDDPPRGPFCSVRCRTLDLGRWASEEFRMPVAPDQDAPPATDAESSNDEMTRH
jgi:endogenous inhibitor of DNA gyrase (YacG/DUF329 family)